MIHIEAKKIFSINIKIMNQFLFLEDDRGLKDINKKCIQINILVDLSSVQASRKGIVREKQIDIFH